MNSLQLLEPRRPLHWPDLIQDIVRHAPDPARLFLVGGTVRDALRGLPLHDIDLATPDDGLMAARALADALGGAYYAVDPLRRTGRVILPGPPAEIYLDVATFRGEDLLADLRGRDFTVNALAVPLNLLTGLIDPLGGQHDLFDQRLLRQCSPASISSDPIRALRAVRQSLQLNLRIERETLAAVRAAPPALLDEQGNLAQPERVRDELFRMLAGDRPQAALRLLHTLGLLAPLSPCPLPEAADLNARLAVVERLKTIFTIISPQRDDNTAADLLLGVAVMVLDRYRRPLQEHLGQMIAGGRPLHALALLGAFTPPAVSEPGTLWAARLRLSNAEADLLNTLSATRRRLPRHAPDRRQIHRYYRACGETGVTGVLLMLAETLATQPPGTVRPEEWGERLETLAAPLLDAFFRRHQQIVSPPPLLDGHALLHEIGLPPGPRIGAILEQVLEAQAAGEVRTRAEALRLAERLAAEL